MTNDLIPQDGMQKALRMLPRFLTGQIICAE